MLSQLESCQPDQLQRPSAAPQAPSQSNVVRSVTNNLPTSSYVPHIHSAISRTTESAAQLHTSNHLNRCCHNLTPISMISRHSQHHHGAPRATQQLVISVTKHLVICNTHGPIQQSAATPRVQQNSTAPNHIKRYCHNSNSISTMSRNIQYHFPRALGPLNTDGVTCY